MSLPEQLVSAPEQFGYADYLHTMTPTRFHSRGNTTRRRIKWHGTAHDMVLS